MHTSARSRSCPLLFAGCFGIHPSVKRGITTPGRPQRNDVSNSAAYRQVIGEEDDAAASTAGLDGTAPSARFLKDDVRRKRERKGFG